MPARLWLCLDNLLLDGLSMQILLAELNTATATRNSCFRRCPSPSGIICNNPRYSRPIQILWHGGKAQLRYSSGACVAAALLASGG